MTGSEQYASRDDFGAVEVPVNPHAVVIAARARGRAGVGVRLGLGGELADHEEPVAEDGQGRRCSTCARLASRYTRPDPLTGESLCARCWDAWDVPAGWWWDAVEEQVVELEGDEAAAARASYYDSLEDEGRCPPEQTRAARAAAAVAAEQAEQEAAAARAARRRTPRGYLASLTSEERQAHQAEVRRRQREAHKAKYATDPAYADRVRQQHRASARRNAR